MKIKARIFKVSVSNQSCFKVFVLLLGGKKVSPWSPNSCFFFFFPSRPQLQLGHSHHNTKAFNFTQDSKFLNTTSFHSVSPLLLLFFSSLPPRLRLFSQRTQKTEGPPSLTGTQCALMLFNYRFIPIESALNHSSAIFKLKTSMEKKTNTI